ncbi:MAG: phage portal protein [Chthoniobacteraceae bacterium]
MFGWFRRRHEDKLRWQTDRTQIMYLLPENPREYLDPLSRAEVARRTEWLMEKFGLVKEGVVGCARHVVGTGLSMWLDTTDLDWNREAEEDFLRYSLTKSRFDIAGRRDFYDAQTTAPQQLFARGEFFAANRRNPRWDGEPCVQLFDTTEIETPESMEDDAHVYDGVKLGEFMEPVAYYARKAGGGHEPIPAGEMFHWYEPTGVNQIRGQSAFSPVVDKLVDWRDLEKLVIQTAKTHSALALAVKSMAKVGGRGAFNNVRRRDPSAPESADNAALERAFPGLVAYLGADREVQVINSQSPTDKLEPFLTNLIAPDVFLALGVPAEFFWNPAKQGTASRFILARADLRFSILADALIYGWCTGVAFRYLSHRIQSGKLRAPSDPNWAAKINFQKPARITVDNGRDGNLELKQLADGADNLRGMFARRGLNWRPETRQWIREWIEFDTMLDAEKATPEQKARILAKWRAGMPGAGNPNQQQQQPDDPPDDPNAP